MRSDNLDRWYRRMEKVATLLTNRTGDPPSLEELASVAGVSPFHFHRIWRGLTGETVGETIGRLRAEMAQALLAETGTSVTEVAMATGYSSSQSLARALRSRTGFTPTAIRNGAAIDQHGVDGSDVKLIVRDAVQVVALRRVGGAYVALNALFERVWEWADDTGAIDGLEGIYGVPLDDPRNVPEHVLRYDACLALGPVDPPAPLRLISLPGGPHAQLRHHGSYDDLEPLDQWLVGTWLPQSAFDAADSPLVHHFHNDPESAREADLITDILLPLKAAEVNR